MSNEPGGSGVNRSRRHYGKHSTWLPEDAGSESGEDPSNIVDGLVEIGKLISDNPGLKTDLEFYFRETKKKGRRSSSKKLTPSPTSVESGRIIVGKKRRERAKEVKDDPKFEEKLDRLIKNYLTEKNRTAPDIDGDEMLQGFKNTFTSVGEIRQEQPMDIDSGDEESFDPATGAVSSRIPPTVPSTAIPLPTPATYTSSPPGHSAVLSRQPTPMHSAPLPRHQGTPPLHQVALPRHPGTPPKHPVSTPHLSGTSPGHPNALPRYPGTSQAHPVSLPRHPAMPPRHLSAPARHPVPLVPTHHAIPPRHPAQSLHPVGGAPPRHPSPRQHLFGELPLQRHPQLPPSVAPYTQAGPFRSTRPTRFPTNQLPRSFTSRRVPPPGPPSLPPPHILAVSQHHPHWAASLAPPQNSEQWEFGRYPTSPTFEVDLTSIPLPAAPPTAAESGVEQKENEEPTRITIESDDTKSSAGSYAEDSIPSEDEIQDISSSSSSSSSSSENEDSASNHTPSRADSVCSEKEGGVVNGAAAVDEEGEEEGGDEKEEEAEVNTLYNLISSPPDKDGPTPDNSATPAQGDDSTTAERKEEGELDVSDEDSVDDEEAAALRSMLLQSIKRKKKDPRWDTPPLPKKKDTPPPLSKKKDSPQLIKKDTPPPLPCKEREPSQPKPETAPPSADPQPVSSSAVSTTAGVEQTSPPGTRRGKRRKSSSSVYTIEDVSAMIGTLPTIDDEAFKKYYPSRMQQKRARQRARSFKMEPLDILKEELCFDPRTQAWATVSRTSTHTSGGPGFSWTRLARFLRRTDTLTSRFRQTFTEADEANKATSFDKLLSLVSRRSPSGEGGEGGERDRKVSVDEDLDGMRDLLLQSMVKKPSAGKERSVARKKVLPAVQIGTKPSPAGSPAPSPPPPAPLTITVNDPKEPTPPAQQGKNPTKPEDAPSVKTKPTVSLSSKAKTEGSPVRITRLQVAKSNPNTTLPEVGPSTKATKPQVVLKKSIKPVVLKPLKKIVIKCPSLPSTEPKNQTLAPPSTLQLKESTVAASSPPHRQATPPIKPLVTLIGESEKAKQQTIALAQQQTVSLSQRKSTNPVHESLMPRNMKTLTPEAIMAQRQVNRLIISQYIVNEDLAPIKESTPEAKMSVERRDAIVKRLEPKIKPVVIEWTGSDSSEGEEFEGGGSQGDFPVTPVKGTQPPLPSAQSPVEDAVEQLNSQRSKLTLQVAQLEQRLVDYTLRKKHHTEELQGHQSKLRALESQVARARALVEKGTALIGYLEERRGGCLAELKRKNVRLADVSLRIEQPEKWREQQLAAAKEREKLEEPGPSRVNGREDLPPHEDGKSGEENVGDEEGKEPGEIATDTSDDSSSSASEDLQEAMDSVDDLLKCCLANLNLAPLPRDKLSIKPIIEFFPRPGREVLSGGTGPVPATYTSPLTVFRSYRFSPYYRSKAQLALTSATYTHKIRPDLPLCPHDLHGKCLDQSCQRQHITTATAVSGPELRTQLCVSAGVRISTVSSFEKNHKNLKESELNLLFCSHLNKLRKERKKDFYFVNTSFVPPVLHKERRENASTKEKLSRYSETTTQSYSYNKVIGRYHASVSEVSLSQQCKSRPRDPETWLALVSCQRNRAATPSVLNNTLSKALQYNKGCPELWVEYLALKAELSTSPADLIAHYEQALKLAPSPLLWRNLAPKLRSYSAQLEALDSALKICDLTKPADRECYGELKRDKLFLIYRSGHAVTTELEGAIAELDKLTDPHVLWFTQQLLHHAQTSTISEHPAETPVTAPPSTLLPVLKRAVTLVTDREVLLSLYRLHAEVLAVSSTREAAIAFLSEVPGRRPELFELMEDVVRMGGWVEPDVPWPRLTYLQMEAALENGQTELAIGVAETLIRELVGREVQGTTLRLYRDVLAITLGVEVRSEYRSLTEGLHRTWLVMVHARLAPLLGPADPVEQFRLFSTRLAHVVATSEEINSLRHAIACEPSVEGAQILWRRYFLVMEEECRKDKQLVNVLREEYSHCLKTVPSLSAANFKFHNEVLSKLTSHYKHKEDRLREVGDFLMAYRQNRALLLRYAAKVSHSNPDSVIQFIRQYLKDSPEDEELWTMLLDLSQRSQRLSDTRSAGRDALAALPLSSGILLQVLQFEIRQAVSEEERRELCAWAVSQARDRGIRILKRQ